VYSFDGDWGNDTLWGAYAPYDYFQSDHRERRTLAQDLRLTGDRSRALFGLVRWLAGVYILRLTEADHLQYIYDNSYNGAGGSRLDSSYGATNVALYGSLDADLGTRTSVSAGLRLEWRVANYADSADAATPFPRQSNGMLGGNLSWTHDIGAGRHLYATLARGYKGGGFNIGSQILSEQRSFGPESLWNLESGFKYVRAGSPAQLQLDLFYMRRQRMQVYLSEQLQPNNPLAYVFFTQNAADGENFGLEAQGSYRLDAHWQFSGSAALLHTRYLGVGGTFDSLAIDGRAQPFAPNYELSAALEYQTPQGWFARLDSHALGSFYYYTSDAQTSRSYHLENLRLGYRRGAWTASAWVRNLFAARYAQQGFYFGLTPPNFAPQSFLQRGDPRQIGMTIDYDLPHER
jgi:iron complex outermembrane receptor protein